LSGDDKTIEKIFGLQDVTLQNVTDDLVV
jgi:hypothetical protein